MGIKKLIILFILLLASKQGLFSQVSENFYIDSLNKYSTEIIKKYPDSLISIGEHLETIAKQNKWLRLEAKALKTVASAFYYKKNFKKATRYFQKEAKKLELLKDTLELTNAYYNLGTIYLQIQKYNQSAKWYEQSLELTQMLKKENLVFDLYQRLYTVYDEQKKYKKALAYYKLYYSVKELKNEKELLSLRKERKQAKKIIQIKVKEIKTKNKQLKHVKTIKDSLKKDTRKKGKKIVELKVKNIEKELKIQEEQEKIQDQKRIIVQIGISLIVTLLYIILLILLYYQKKKANKNLAYKNNKIENQKNEIEAQRDEIEKQNEFISTQNKNMLDSIDYARQIQNALIPELNFKRNTLIKDYFILFKPKDLVSGDFYWSSEVNGKLIIAAADCTGHGVPGAFMSILGMTFLDEAVNKKGITQPNLILDETRDQIIHSLKQKKGHSKDGMDISIVTIDKDNLSLQYAGANNPIYIVKDSTLEEVKGDKMPVSFHYKMRSFTCHEIAIERGMSVYLSSDGYSDQFGGEEGKKLKSKNFKNLLVENSDETSDMQKDILEEEFVSWMGEHDQIDDMLVIGLKF